MIDDLGMFRTTIHVSSMTDEDDRLALRDVVVDTRSLYSWIPRDLLESLGVRVERWETFESADGRILEREIGWAMLFVAGRVTPTIVAFADPGDMVLLGAVALRGLNLRIDLARKELVPAGPVPVAVAA